MTCDEIDGVLTPFIDGELHGDAMREVARHLVRCARCEAEAVHLERLQASIRGAVNVATGNVDLRAAWSAIASRLDPDPVPWWGLTARLEGWRAMPLRFPLVVGGAAAAALAAVLLLSQGTREERGKFVPPPHTLAQQARIDSLSASGNVRIWNTADTGAVVIWVDDAGMNVERLDP